MRRVDEVHLEMPWFGARGLRRVLRPEFPGVGRRHLGTLLRRMARSAQAPQPGTSRRHRAHPVYPYLRRNRRITRPNEVWAMDIPDTPMARGFVYLAVVLDGASRKALSWLVSITLDSVLCVAALADGLARYGRPAIVNTDQGAQFTGAGFADVSRAHDIRLSLDGTGCWRDHSFVERLWRTLKYEEVYLHACDTVSAATAGMDRHLTLYNTRRPHSSLADQTPDEADFTPTRLPSAAA